MPNVRFKAIEAVLGRPRIDVKFLSNKVSDYYGKNVFTLETMRNYLSKSAYKSVVKSIETGAKIDRNIADQVAGAMRAWATDKGATSYCHWFQPLTGATAEKHDTFFTPDGSGSAIEAFSGDELVQQEPDGSSFPSGGLRATFEARGYTAWDPSSPAFIMSVGQSVKTLCIPTIFVSYTGESLDYKAPLLKSQHNLEMAAVDVCHYFNKNVKKVTPTLGWEQEYFLVDASLFYARPDLVATGRTLLGASSPKGQQLDDHYFGSIPERVYAYMVDFEQEAHKLGISISTRHNEVAPGQYECAPVFSDANTAVDHNQLLMDIMDRVARRHSLRVLLHEKPYAGVNGSGKHNNWSMATDTGINLLSPGHTPKTNIQFLTFFINIIKAVYENGDLLRAAIASSGNDHRLGANEAPPAIISVFIGSTLTGVLNDLEKKVKPGGIDDYAKNELKLDIHNKIPDLLQDNTDRNRTSPFAFTGNKFEVRAVGSSANCGLTMTALNAMVAQQLREFKAEVDELVANKETKDGAIFRVLRRYVKQMRPILFEGDNYSEAWAKEAKKRGLSNVKTTPYALDFFLTDKARKVLVDGGIYTERELHARYDVWQEIYQMKIDIESNTLLDMVQNQVVPSAVNYQNRLIDNLKGAKEVGVPAKSLKGLTDLVKDISQHLNELFGGVQTLKDALAATDKIEDVAEKSKAYCDKVKPCFDGIRLHADALEQLVDDDLWSLPKYRELMFVR